jgi:hypothetical protein
VSGSSLSGLLGLWFKYFSDIPFFSSLSAIVVLISFLAFGLIIGVYIGWKIFADDS